MALSNVLKVAYIIGGYKAYLFYDIFFNSLVLFYQKRTSNPRSVSS